MKKSEYEAAVERYEKPYQSWIKENEKEEYYCEDMEKAREKVLEKYYVFASEGASIEKRLYDYVLNLPDSDFIYTDEDIYDSGALSSKGKISAEDRSDPYFKGEWAPETIRSFYYPGSLTLVKKEIADRIEKEYSYERASNDFLRECALASKSHLHINEVLVHVDRLNSLDYANVSEPSDAEFGVTAVILSKDHPEMLEQCVSGLNKTARTENVALRTIVVDNGSSEEHTRHYEALSKLHEFEYYKKEMPFEYSTLCNYGASLEKDNRLLLFLNDDIEIPEETVFLREMAEMASKAEVGAVGCKLLYPGDNKIQHNGITFLKSGPSHRLCTYPDDREYLRGVNRRRRNVLAVTGAALMCEAKKFREIKGFDERLKIAYTDVDLCFAFLRAGYRNVCLSDFYLIHHESLSRKDDTADRTAYRRLKNERVVFEKKYSEIIEKGDIYESGKWSKTSLEYIPELLMEEERLGAAKEIERVDKRRFSLKRAGKKFHYSLDSVEFKLNDAFGNENFYEIKGWAFMGGSPGYEYDVRIVLEADGERYITGAARSYRKDIELVFADEKDCRLSGFDAKIDAALFKNADAKIYIALVKPKFFGKNSFKGELADSGRHILFSAENQQI